MNRNEHPPTHDARLISTSPEQTMEIAAQVAARLQPGDIVTLSGPLGAGKTCFVRGLALGLGIDPRQVSSPTFVLAQEYESSDDTTRQHAIKTLVHVDAYRMTGQDDDLESIGWDEMITSNETAMAVEWPERLGDQANVPADRLCEVELAHDETDGNTRHIHLTFHRHGVPCTQDAPMIDSQKNATDTHCPTCKRKIEPTAPTYPFCSDRCRWADLGKWIDGDYRISREVTNDDELDS